jgi:hypothetical protein
MTTKTFLLAAFGAVSLYMTAHAAVPGAPDKMALPVDGRGFSATSVGISDDGSHVCIAGADRNDMGVSTARLLLVDRARRTVAWNKTIPVPDGLATLYVVQCVTTADRVYLLANAETSLSPPQAQSKAYVYAFDLSGNESASENLKLPVRSVYGYTIDAIPDGLKVVGATRDQQEETERYGTYTMTLDRTLRPRGTPVLRKNGAYMGPDSARIVGDSVYVSGLFFPATVKQTEVGESMASRLRVDGGYVWSTRTPSPTRLGTIGTVADDGAAYSIGNLDDKTVLEQVTPGGKALPPLTYRSSYCDSRALLGYAGKLIAIRERCNKKVNTLISIDTTNGNETVLKPIPDEPMFIAAKGDLWTMLARDGKGRMFLYSAANGGL